MRHARTSTLLLLALTLSACSTSKPGPQGDPATYRPTPGDVKTVPELGEVGLWMITPEIKPATWLGESYGGKTLREPINVLFLDKAATSADQAVSRLLSAMNAAGYGPKNMHSDGYYGYLNGGLKIQYPQGKGEAFSDAHWYRSNNHGRIFGPFSVPGGFAFTAAFSREDFKLLPKPRHTYSTFNGARDDLAAKLSAGSTYKTAGLIDLGSVIDTDTETTADHDGKAVLLIAEK